MNDTAMNRRQFLRTGCAVGAAVACSGLFPLFASAGQGGATIQQTKVVMGTFVTITTTRVAHNMAEEAIARAFAEVDRLVSIFDRHSTSSVLGHLNQQGVLRHAPQELQAVLAQAMHIGAASEGFFNPAIAPVLGLLQQHKTTAYTATIPAAELADALALADMKAVESKNGTLRLSRTGMALSLDGIAKGAIVDKAAAVLEQAGVANFLINAGGDIIAKGTSEHGKPWQVGVENPAQKGSYLTVAGLSNKAIATSAGYEAAYDASGKTHHLINPYTGKSPDIISVSVVAGTTALADALATTLAVLPAPHGLALAKRFNADCYIIGTNGQPYVSNGWGLLEGA